MKKTLILFTILVVCLTGIHAQYTIETVPNPKSYNQYVSNPDGILQQSTVDILNQKIHQLYQENSSELAVVVLNSIGNENIDIFANQLFGKWGIGQKDINNGLLVLFVMDQRLIKFETGYGLEGVFPDAISKRIQTQDMIPYFKKGNYDQGFVAGIDRIIATVKGEKFVQKNEKIDWNEYVPYAMAVYLILIVITLIWINSTVNKVKNSVQANNLAKYKLLKSEKNGIISIMAIGLPVLAFIAILLWGDAIFLLFVLPVPLTVIPANIYAKIAMTKIRRAPISCPECNGKMRLLSEKKEDAYLSLSQQFEEQLSAVDYDVFVCDDCKNEAIFTLDKPSIYTECPRCQTKAFILHDKKVIVEPSFVNSGIEKTTYKCKFCGYEENNNTKLPRLNRDAGAFAAGALAGSIFSGRGGFGGGGFGGGGFGGGGFGGGMSGGGGSSSGW